MNTARLFALAASLTAAACGSNDTASARHAGAGGRSAIPRDAAPDASRGTTCPPKPTGFPGDEMCLEPPRASEGFQLHYGPADYDDPDELATFTLNPGEETNDCFLEQTPNAEDAYYGGYEIQMRPGSHHLIGQSRTTVAERQGFDACENSDGNPTGLFAGSQTPKLDFRVDPAPENAGLGRLIPAKTQAVLNFHVINATGAPLLREAWLNYFYLDRGDLRGMRSSITLTGGLGFSIQPGTHATYKYSCSPTEPIRILTLASHMHAHAKRMTVYRVGDYQSAKPSVQKVLEGYSWEEPAQLFYDSAHTTPPADPATQTPGGNVSGDLYVTPTDAIQWECEIQNDGDTVLTFRNEVFTGEMCLVVGTAVSVSDPTRVADFTCNRN